MRLPSQHLRTPVPTPYGYSRHTAGLTNTGLMVFPPPQHALASKRTDLRTSLRASRLGFPLSLSHYLHQNARFPPPLHSAQLGGPLAPRASATCAHSHSPVSAAAICA